MRLTRHVGGLSVARQRNYLETRGWREVGDGWVCERHGLEPQKRSRALHHQLTEDLALGLGPSGWKVAGYSPRGYVKLADPRSGDLCSLPAALRRQAKRDGRPVAELTYILFLAALQPSSEG